MVSVIITALSGKVVYTGSLPRDIQIQDLKKILAAQAEKAKLFSGGEELEDTSTLAALTGHLGPMGPTSDAEPVEQTLALTLLNCRCPVAADVEGSWFGHQHWVQRLLEADCEVHLLNGVCWFNAWGVFNDIEGGEWRIFLKLKRKQRIRFDTNLLVSFNDAKVQTFSPEVLSSLPAEQWTLMELGPFHGPGRLAVDLRGEDCQQRGQNSKQGLYIGQLIAQPS